MPAGPTNPLPGGVAHFMVEADLTKMPPETPPGGADAVLLVAYTKHDRTPRLLIRYGGRRTMPSRESTADEYFRSRDTFDPFYFSLDSARPKETVRFSVEVRREDETSTFDLAIAVWATADLYAAVQRNYKQAPEDFPLGQGRALPPTRGSLALPTPDPNRVDSQPPPKSDDSEKESQDSAPVNAAIQGGVPMTSIAAPDAVSGGGNSTIFIVLGILACLITTLLALVLLVRLKQRREDKKASRQRPPSVYLTGTSNVLGETRSGAGLHQSFQQPFQQPSFQEQQPFQEQKDASTTWPVGTNLALSAAHDLDGDEYI